MIIDAESHLIDPSIAKSAEELKETEVFFIKKIYFHPEGKYALKLAIVENLLSSMESSNIDKALIMGLPFLDNLLNKMNNEYIYRACRQYSNKFLGLGILNPFDKNFIKGEIKKFKNEYGFIGIKVIPSWQGFKLDSEDFYPAVEEIIKNNLILLPHINYIISGLSEDSPHSLFNLANRFPELKILAPHLGGLLCFHYLYTPIKKVFKNIRFITSIPETIKLVEYASEILDDNQLIFGTDYPFQPNHDQLTIVNKFEKLKLKPGLKEKIYSQNLMEFLNV